MTPNEKAVLDGFLHGFKHARGMKFSRAMKILDAAERTKADAAALAKKAKIAAERLAVLEERVSGVMELHRRSPKDGTLRGVAEYLRDGGDRRSTSMAWEP